LVIAKQWQRLAALVDISAVPFAGQSGCLVVLGGIASSRLKASDFLRAALDTAAAHYGAIVAQPSLKGCAGNFVGGFFNDSLSTRRSFAAAKLRAVADSLHGAGSDAFAYRALRQ